MKKCYISGKVRGLPEEDARAAFAAASKEVSRLGMEPVNPFDVVGRLPMDVAGDERRLLLALLEELSACDSIWMIDGWRDGSNGAACEYYYAKSAGIKVLNDTPDALTLVLDRLYSPSGTTEALALKTSAEVAMEIEDMCPTTPMDIASWLRSHGYSTRVLAGTVCWVLYEKEETLL